MSRQQIRRLPVVDGEEHIIGVVSLGDIARCTARRGDGDVARSLAEISKPRRSEPAPGMSASPAVPRGAGSETRETGNRRTPRPAL
jgi:CBS-domain-containing membrane protein